jgi:CRISPR/Cas system-associated exonuclease Cas4 (RecB family)
MSLEIVKVDFSEDIIGYCKGLLEETEQNVVFITSHKRPIRFLNKRLEFTKVLNTDFFTIEEFVEKINFEHFSDFKVHTPPERYLFFLELIVEKLPRIANNFISRGKGYLLLKWAKRLSALFDEIERQLLFSNLRDFQYVENILEVKILLENLKTLYEDYDRKYNENQILFLGRMFKNAADITKSESFITNYKDSTFVFGGFASLTNSEKKIIENLSNHFCVKYIIQTDLNCRDIFSIDEKEYSFDTFSLMAEVEKSLKYTDITEVNNSFYKTNFQFYEFSNAHEEALFIADKISEILKNDKDIKLEEIGVVIPENFILLPLLNALNVKKINVTMGYPFYLTDIGIFIDALFNLLIDLQKNKKNCSENRVSVPVLLKFLNTNISLMLDEKFNIAHIKQKIFSSNISFYKFDDDCKLFKEIFLLFLNCKSFNCFYEAFLKLFEHFDRSTLNRDENRFTVQMLQLFYQNIVTQIKKLHTNQNVDILFFYHFLQEILKSTNVPFEGHPLQGVQILGSLEARMLNFKYLVYADVNENIIPNLEEVDPLVPEDIKSELKLTSYKDREKVVKYNFFRQIYSAKDVTICYRSGVSSSDKYLKSRFLEQLILSLEMEKKEKIAPKIFNRSFAILKKLNNFIEKTAEIDEHFKNLNSFSPSALDIYLTCPYKYYLSKIKQISPFTNFENIFEANTVGTYVHILFEDGFKKYINKKLEKNDLEHIKYSILENLEKWDKFFEGKLFNNKEDEEIAKLKEYLLSQTHFETHALKVILNKRVENYFDTLLNDFQSFTVYKTEYQMKSFAYKLHGIADRVDKIDNNGSETIRIVDYKTGQSVNTPKITKLSEILEFEDFDEQDIVKLKNILVSCQMPAYLIMADELFKDQDIKVSIFYLGRSKNNIKELDKINIDYYKLAIKNIISHMNESKKIYAIKDEHCRYCDYKNVCKFN